MYPVKIPDFKDIKGPLVFFGGPDKGGGDWRKRAYDLFAEKFGDDFCAAMPCKYEDSHPFAAHRLPPPKPRGEPREHVEVEQPLRKYTRLDWIEYVADMAAIHLPQGCVIYYFPLESATEPRSDGNPYAMNSRFEIGLLLGRTMYDRNNIRFVLGIDQGFPGRKAIVANYKKRLRHFDVYDNLEDTVKSAFKRMEQDNWSC